MVAKISQEEREKQIKKLCEGTIYSFVGWDGEYKNQNSKFICKCEEHGEWLVSVDNFVTKNSRCPSCSGIKHLSQEEREKQIKELCEGTIYSFVKWDGEYKNAHSKFVCKCEKHGEWVAKVYSFVAKSNRCRHCCYESRKKRLTLPQEKREQQIKNALDSTSSSFVKWFNLYENQYSKVVLKCEKHGDWERRVADLLKSNICPECTKEKQAIKNYYFTQDECELYIAKLCEGTHYSFAGWKNSYKGISSSRFSCSCALHGKYEVSLYSFIRGHRCQKCMGEKSASIKQTPKNEIEKRIKDRCVNTRWSFLNWDGEYKNQNSKFICKCEEHGDWVVSIANFISKGSRCPSCSVTGYNLTIKGSLYCLRSQCGQFIKIGISNKPKQRFTQLKRKTPFDFHIVELFTHEDGRKAQEWEKLFHQSFESANLTGFDGCTEWLKWNPQIPLWFRFLT